MVRENIGFVQFCASDNSHLSVPGAGKPIRVADLPARPQKLAPEMAAQGTTSRAYLDCHFHCAELAGRAGRAPSLQGRAATCSRRGNAVGSAGLVGGSVTTQLLKLFPDLAKRRVS
ncbi:hypothetical protein H2204_011966 [Knufia peltigerae]|uniref:Uncharacterized protein n=1 Tax=Knufia peltigerae TaxID=1002370 RepID=A0AA39CRD9_9EURO|nr:hypothetical protein H2204_011966 [Knufia peltigerae]